MSPVEPRPLVIGTMALPSTDDLDFFLPESQAASSPAGALRVPLASPSAERNERRFQPNFKFMRGYLSISLENYSPAGWLGALTTMALPTISISESPGI